MRKIYHALTLNLHQPPGNLQWLLDHNEWEGAEILRARCRLRIEAGSGTFAP